ncbi:MAG: hypothetical protein KIT47_22665, partial [Rhodoferax sp.]|nr:hypothetical protein [Rhodoferax sp.]
WWAGETSGIAKGDPSSAPKDLRPSNGALQDSLSVAAWAHEGDHDAVLEFPLKGMIQRENDSEVVGRSALE